MPNLTADCGMPFIKQLIVVRQAHAHSDDLDLWSGVRAEDAGAPPSRDHCHVIFMDNEGHVTMKNMMDEKEDMLRILIDEIDVYA